MKKGLFLSVLIIAFLFCFSFGICGAEEDYSDPFDEVYSEEMESGEIEYDERTLLLETEAALSSEQSATLKSYGVSKTELLMETESGFIYEGYLKKGFDIEETISLLREVFPDFVIEYNFEQEVESITPDVSTLSSAYYSSTKNPLAKDSFHLRYCGIQPYGWDTGYTGQGVRIAIIDTGFLYTHPELINRIPINGQEQNGKTGVDDDNNGVIDDIYGANVVTGEGSAEIVGDDTHGTHVMGIIGAENNSVGTLGVAYNARIIPITTGHVDETDGKVYFSSSDQIKALKYADKRGVDIVNMSLGGTTYNQTVYNAIKEISDRTLVVASAGNKHAGSKTGVTYPAGYDNVLGVMNMGVRSFPSDGDIGTEWKNTNYNDIGNHVYDIYAPGVDIYSTVFKTNNHSPSYDYKTGTSMSSPYVVGVAALVRQKYSDRTLYPVDVLRTQLTSTYHNSSYIEKHSGFPDHDISAPVVNVQAALKVIPVTRLKMNNSGLTLFPGDTLDLKAYVTPADATKRHALTWKYSNPSVVSLGSVDYNKNQCQITCLKPGSATVTVSEPDGKSATCNIVVKSDFKDVKSSDFFYDAVHWAVSAGVTTGISSNSFAPNDICSRAQTVTFLWRCAGQPDPTNMNNPFTDIKSSDWYYKAVLWAVEKGITNGTSAKTFGPNMNCTRSQVVTFLWRAKGSPKVGGSCPFTDVKASQYYYDAVIWATNANITSGTGPKTFSPEMICSRGQIVTFLYRCYK